MTKINRRALNELALGNTLAQKQVVARTKSRKGQVRTPVRKRETSEGEVLEKRRILITDFGSYLRRLRMEKGVLTKDLAAKIGYSEGYVHVIEYGNKHLPSERRLALWLEALGLSPRLPEALRLLRSVKHKRTIQYRRGDEINEHLDRLLDAYDNDTLKDIDKQLLTMIALREYSKGVSPEPENTKELKPRTRKR